MWTMQPRHGPLLTYGSRSLSKTLRPDDQRVKALLLNLTGIAGLLFLALALLHLTHGLATSHAFHAYLGLFLGLEGIFVAVRLYTFFRKKSGQPSRADYEEAGIIVASKNPPDSPSLYWSGASTEYKPSPQYWISQSTADERSKKAAHVKRNSL